MCSNRLHFRVKSWERVSRQASSNRTAKANPRGPCVDDPNPAERRRAPLFSTSVFLVNSKLARLGDRVMQTLFLTSAVLLFSFLPFVPPAYSQPIDTKLLGEMHWRNVGGFFGGGRRAVSGIPGQPNIFYIGAVNGGVWKTTDFGRTWAPIFDREATGSIGDRKNV